jgi:hypothetical protein
MTRSHMDDDEHLDNDTLEAVIAELERRSSALEAEHRTVAGELREQQLQSGMASKEVFRNMAAARAKPLAEKEQALREQLRILREKRARFERQLASARLPHGRAGWSARQVRIGRNA